MQGSFGPVSSEVHSHELEVVEGELTLQQSAQKSKSRVQMGDGACMAAASDPGQTRATESMPARQLYSGWKEKQSAGAGRREG